jgi:hypothetical protein
MSTFLFIIANVVVGTLVYALTKFVIDNVLKQRKIIGEISRSLVLYRSWHQTPVSDVPGSTPELKKASAKFYKLSALLLSTLDTICWYCTLEKVLVVRKRTDIEIAANELRNLSNGCNEKSMSLPDGLVNNAQCHNKIVTCLKLNIPKI